MLGWAGGGAILQCSGQLAPGYSALYTAAHQVHVPYVPCYASSVGNRLCCPALICFIQSPPALPSRVCAVAVPSGLVVSLQLTPNMVSWLRLSGTNLMRHLWLHTCIAGEFTELLQDSKAFSCPSHTVLSQWCQQRALFWVCFDAVCKLPGIPVCST